MLLPVHKYIAQKLEQKKLEHNFRQLNLAAHRIDFTSNDYLGFAKNKLLKAKTVENFSENPTLINGSTGSRLLSGNSTYAEKLEHDIAHFHQAESALLFNSGFDANYGLFSTLPYKGDTVLYDQMVHASIHDGMRHSKANCVAFAHNDATDLEAKLQLATGVKYVVVESLYSMNGDFSPLTDLAMLCEKYEAALIVDEAHTFGLCGNQGQGRVQDLNMTKKCFARIITYGKAAGVAGACIVGCKSLKEFLINYCRPLIFSTAMLPYQLAAIAAMYSEIPKANEERKQLFERIDTFREEAKKWGLMLPSEQGSPIQIVPVSGNEKVIAIAEYLQQNGFDVRPIKHPTVPKGHERLRVCLHGYNTKDEITAFVKLITNYLHA